jgi:RNA-directed DNA polymerase
VQFEATVPTIRDRVVQTAAKLVIEPIFEADLEPNTYGYRPRRSAGDAIAAVHDLLRRGHTDVVDADLSKYFDTIPHEQLMQSVARRIADGDILKLIKMWLKAPVEETDRDGRKRMTGGKRTKQGTPQGGVISPLLSNLMLDVLDKELEKRGHRFVRYADDCNIYVCSQRAGERVMTGIEQFLAKRLKLKVNKAKSAVAKPSVRKFLGFSFTGGNTPRRRIAPQAIDRFKARVRELTRRTCGRSLSQIAKELSRYLVGWRGYFGFCETPSVLLALDQWTRRRMRAIAWKQWKRGRTRFARLRRRGVGRDLAAQTAGSPHGPWRLSNSPALTLALPNAFFASLGLATVALKRAA